MFRWNLELLEELEDCIESLSQTLKVETYLDIKIQIFKKRKELNDTI